MAFVWRSIEDEHDMREAWQSLAGQLENPSSGEFVVQQMAPAGVPVTVRGFEDPLFGPIMSFGWQAPRASYSATGPTGSRR
jgi:hypothetical protein